MEASFGGLNLTRISRMRAWEILRRTSLIAVTLVPLLAGCDVANKSPKQITIATGGNYPPWSFSKPDGSLGGYEIDLIHLLCTNIQIKCRVITQDFDGIIPGLVLGRYDAIVSAMSATEERKKVVAFSIPYARAPIGFLIARGSRLTNLPGTGSSYDFTKSAITARLAIKQLRMALKGKAIGVPVGTTFESFADAYFSDQTLVRYPSFAQIGLELASGRIDVALDNVTAFKAIIDSSPKGILVQTGPTFSGGTRGVGTMNIAFRPQDEALRKSFDTAIRSINQNGINKALTEKWFSTDISIHKVRATETAQLPGAPHPVHAHLDSAGG